VGFKAFLVFCFRFCFLLLLLSPLSYIDGVLIGSWGWYSYLLSFALLCFALLCFALLCFAYHGVDGVDGDDGGSIFIPRGKKEKRRECVAGLVRTAQHSTAQHNTDRRGGHSLR